MLNDILNVGVSTDTHNENIKKRGNVRTIRSWAKSLIHKEKKISEAKDAKACGNSIRQYVSSTAKDSNGNSCEFATRLLGANNKALSIPTANGNVEVFPSNSIKVAKDIFSALVEAVRTDETVQQSVVRQLKKSDFRGDVQQLVTAFEEGS